MAAAVDTALPSRVKRRPGGSHAQTPSPPTAFSPASERKANRQEKRAAISPASSLPLNPPRIVPVTYAATADPTPSAHSSLIYAAVTTEIPGVQTPTRKRQKISSPTVADVAASALGIACSRADGTITRLRPHRSAINPAIGASPATPSVAAVITRLMVAADVPNSAAKTGSRGC